MAFIMQKLFLGLSVFFFESIFIEISRIWFYKISEVNDLSKKNYPPTGHATVYFNFISLESSIQ